MSAMQIRPLEPWEAKIVRKLGASIDTPLGRTFLAIIGLSPPPPARAVSPVGGIDPVHSIVHVSLRDERGVWSGPRPLVNQDQTPMTAVQFRDFWRTLADKASLEDTERVSMFGAVGKWFALDGRAVFDKAEQ